MITMLLTFLALCCLLMCLLFLICFIPEIEAAIEWIKERIKK
jgi:hypothetical protein